MASVLCLRSFSSVSVHDIRLFILLASVVRGFLARCRYKVLVKKARQQEEEVNSFLLQMAKMSLDQQQKMSKILQGDKKIPKGKVSCLNETLVLV